MKAVSLTASASVRECATPEARYNLASLMGLAQGTKLGPYEIQSALGAGGMGEVYRARDTRLERNVAVKILPAHLSSHPDAKQRFEREARIISSLNHPNICHLYDIGCQDGVDFLVMEFLEGDTLADRLHKGPLPPDQLLKVGIEICEGLQAAHKGGVVHRDLKPGNIMLTKSGAKLMDFGLAKPADAANPPSSGLTATIATPVMTTPAASRPLTAQGTVVGTFQYISPEQLEGGEADVRSDIFALGAVLYEMATGERAFEGKTVASVIAAVLERDPGPVSAVQPTSPPALDRVVKTCLAKDPDERFQTAHDLELQLKWIAEGGSHASLPAPALAKGKLRERTLAAAALLFAILVGIFATEYLHRPSSVAPEVRASLLPPEGTSFLNGTSTSGFALSPDGTRLAFFAQAVEGKISLWVRPLNSTAAQEVTGTEDGAFPFWSPDGQWIAFFAEGKLKKISASGGAVQTICDAPAGRGGSWSPSGLIIFAPSIGGPLFRVSADGGAATPLTQLDVSQGETTQRWPSFLPDGVHFLYVARQVTDNQPGGVYVGSLNSPARKKILDTLLQAAYAAPGFLVFARKTTLFAQRFDASSLKVEGDPVPIVQDAAVLPNVLRSGFAVSETGRLVYSSSSTATDLELIATDRAGKVLSTLETAGTPGTARLSPDGRKLALSEADRAGGGSAIWVYDLKSGVRSRFTFGEGLNINPVWSPDGSQLAFTSSRSGNFNIFVKPASGAGEDQPVHPASDDERSQSWSPDGKYLVLDSRPQSRLNLAEITILPMTGDHKPYHYIDSPYSNYGGQVSPDGRWLAYVSTESGRPQVYVSTFPQAKGKWQISTTGGQAPLWRRDGREIFYCRTDGALEAVEVAAAKDSFAVVSMKQLSDKRIFQSVYSAPYDVFPDGQRIILSAVKAQALHAPLTLVTNWTSEVR